MHEELNEELKSALTALVEVHTEWEPHLGVVALCRPITSVACHHTPAAYTHAWETVRKHLGMRVEKTINQ